LIIDDLDDFCLLVVVEKSVVVLFPAGFDFSHEVVFESFAVDKSWVHLDEETDWGPINAVFKASAMNFQVDVVGFELFDGSPFDFCKCDGGVDRTSEEQAPIVHASGFNTKTSSNFFFFDSDKIRADLNATGIIEIDFFLLSLNVFDGPQ